MSPPLLIVARFLHDASALLLGGVAAFRWLYLWPALRRCDHRTRSAFAPLRLRFDLLFLGAFAALMLSGLVLFWGVAAEMSDTSLRASLDLGTWSSVFFNTRFGEVIQVRLVLAAVLTVVVGVGGTRREPARREFSLRETLVGLACAVLIASLAWTGHSGAVSGDTSLHLAVAAFHLLAAAVWPTGLVPLLLFLFFVHRNPSRIPLPATRCVVERFSNVSLIVVGFLTASGALNTCFVLKTWSALFSSYGLVLAAKVLLLAVILGFAAWNRLRNIPAFARLSTGEDPSSQEKILRRLRIFVAAEGGLAAVVILVAAILGSTAPPP